MAAADAPRATGPQAELLDKFYANVSAAMEAEMALREALADSMVGVMVRVVDDRVQFMPISAEEFYAPPLPSEG